MGLVSVVNVDLHGLEARELLAATGALDKAMDFLLDKTRGRTPVYSGWAGATGYVSGALRESAHVIKMSETLAVIEYPLPYSRKQEEREWQKHPSGGQAHFLRDTWDIDMDEALDILINTMVAGQ